MKLEPITHETKLEIGDTLVTRQEPFDVPADIYTHPAMIWYRVVAYGKDKRALRPVIQTEELQRQALVEIGNDPGPWWRLQDPTC